MKIYNKNIKKVYKKFSASLRTGAWSLRGFIDMLKQNIKNIVIKKLNQN
jgi:hypothetical protein